MDKKARSLSVRIVAIGVLLIAAVLTLGQDVPKKSAGKDRLDLRVVTLSMQWARGDPHYGPKFISLSTPCQASGDVPCECTMQFRGTNSLQFADYISSFGDEPIDVVYEVRYGPDGLVHQAQLESVGSWQADRFPVNDRLLGIRSTFKDREPGQKQKAKLRNPADCFPPRRN
jgi:hypothetical protein